MPVDDKTPLGFPLPHPTNDPYFFDVPRMRQALMMIDELITEQAGDAADQVATIKGSPPAGLDTLQELAAALENNPNVLAGLRTLIGTKASAEAVAIALSNISQTITNLGDSLTPRIDALERNSSTRARLIARGIAYSGVR